MAPQIDAIPEHNFSPIELAWRKVKARPREEGARPQDRLRSAIDEAMQSVTIADAHCGNGRLTKSNEALQNLRE